MQTTRPFIFGTVPKLPAKYVGLIMPLFLSGLMSAALSMMNMLINLGFIEHFFSKWLFTWLLSWMMAFPTVLIFLPIVRRLTGLIVDLGISNTPK